MVHPVHLLHPEKRHLATNGSLLSENKCHFS